MRLSDLKPQKKSPKTAPAPRAPAAERLSTSKAPPSEALTAQALPPDSPFGKSSPAAPEARKAYPPAQADSGRPGSPARESSFRLSTLSKQRPESLPASRSASGAPRHSLARASGVSGAAVSSAQPMQAGHSAYAKASTSAEASADRPAGKPAGKPPTQTVVPLPVSIVLPPESPPVREPSPASASLPEPGAETEVQQSNLRLTGLLGKKPEVSPREISVETPPPAFGPADAGGAPEAPKQATQVEIPEPIPALPARPPAAPEAQLLRAGSGYATGVAGGPELTPPEPTEVPESSSEAPEEAAAAAAEEPLPEEIPGRFTEHPAGVYEVAKQLGIVLPVDKETFIENKVDCLRVIFKKCQQPAPEKEIIWPMIKSEVSDISNLLALNSSVLHFLRRQQAKSADQLVWHSFYTAILAMDLAGQVADLGCPLEDIGGAALIHDLGLVGLPPGSATSVIEGPDIDEEHIQRGVELARRIGVPAEVLTMISQHHGRLDGSGYPPGLSARTFPRYSQVVAIADLFERTMIGIVKPKKKAAGELSEFNISQVFRKYRKCFNPELLKKMIDVIGFYPVGSFVELSNHALCRVVEQNRDFPLHPVVQVIIDGAGVHPEAEKMIDLKQVQLLSIIRQVDMPIETAESAT